MRQLKQTHAYDQEPTRPGGAFSGARDSLLTSQTSVIETTARAFGYYAELGQSRCLKDFKGRINEALTRLDIDDYVFVNLENPGCGQEEISTVDPQLTMVYREAGLYEHDMTLPYAREHLEPIFHSSLQDYAAQSPVTTDTVRAMKEIDEQNRSFGYYDFYSTLSPSSNGEGHVMLAVSQRGLNPAELKQIIKGRASSLQLLCEAIDFVAMQKFSGDFSVETADARNIKITPKPLRVLATLANNDLSIAQVAEKLHIGTVTASKHLETARKALEVKTNHGAIKKAVALGLIDY